LSSSSGPVWANAIDDIDSTAADRMNGRDKRMKLLFG